jgi:hypothetical protein
MSPQLREGLRAAADGAGLSVNAYAVQVLAAAAGDPARFRAPVPEAEAVDLRTLERDALGFPLRSKERREHSSARSVFMDAMMSEAPDEWFALVKKYDSEDPGYYVEWMRRRTAAEQPPVVGYSGRAPSP